MTENTPASGEPGSILSPAEIREAKAEAKLRVNAALKEAERDRVIADEEQRIQRAEGLRTGRADMDETVIVLIDLAEFCDKIIINGTQYFHGHTYEVPRHVANTMRETMQRTYRHQMVIDGKELEETYRRNKPVLLTPSGARPLVENAL